MSTQNIFTNDAAMAIINDAASRLQSLGVHCMVSPMHLPQGMTVSLHVGATTEAVTAANKAAECGGEYAHAADTRTQFARSVDMAIADTGDKLLKGKRFAERLIALGVPLLRADALAILYSETVDGPFRDQPEKAAEVYFATHGHKYK